MTAASAPAAARPRPPARGRWPGWTRLLRLELRHNAMAVLLPVAVALFWFAGYRKAMAVPPLWNMRAAALQAGAVLTFTSPVAGAAAWMGCREARRRTADLAGIAARPRWARLLATWAATTIWALAALAACTALLYGVTARQASWGGPLWWPAAVAAASLPAMAALGLAAGTLVPGRFTAPLTAVAAFFALALSTQLITGSQSYWTVSPVVTGPWDLGRDPGVAVFYPYVPDLAIAQVLFLAALTAAVLGALALPAGRGWRRPARVAAAVTAAGLLAAGGAVALAGTGRLDSHGMLAIPALHDAASDRPVHYSPVCSTRTAIPVCVHPAFARYLPATAAGLAPALSQIAGLPGAPVRISQAAATYRQGPGNSVGIGLACPRTGGSPAVLRLLLPYQFGGPPVTADLAVQVRSSAGPAIVASVVGGGRDASPAQRAVWAALLIAAKVASHSLPPAGTLMAGSGPAGLPVPSCGPGSGPLGAGSWAAPGTAVAAAARRFAALPATTRHAWLVRHLARLRSGRISLRQLP